MIRRLYPYQREVASAVMQSVCQHRGLTFSVEIARQGGKNELSAQLELLLLTLSMAQPGNLVKCAPTFKPQLNISMMRLKDRLEDAGFHGIWCAEAGYIIRLGLARAIFLSAEESASVVGNTAHLLLEVDESQDVSRDKYTKEFKPMGASTNVTTVHYGTAWDDNTLLEEVKRSNLELQQQDGIQRHFRYDWEIVASYNPRYLEYVQGERQRLGEDHPLFMTQYRLLPVHGGSGFLNQRQQAQLQGTHSRCRQPESGKCYVAGIDLGGEGTGESLPGACGIRQDATVITIGEMSSIPGGSIPAEPCIRIMEHYCWRGQPHAELYAVMVDLLGRVWHCRQVVVDATGLGQPVASFLRRALGSRVTSFVFTAPSKSALGFNLLAAINSGRLKMYAADASAEYREFWEEINLSRSYFRANQTLAFQVDPERGHDDFLMSLALMVEAGSGFTPRIARGVAPVIGAEVR